VVFRWVGWARFKVYIIIYYTIININDLNIGNSDRNQQQQIVADDFPFPTPTQCFPGKIPTRYAEINKGPQSSKFG
jgi:hypothetical protein